MEPIFTHYRNVVSISPRTTPVSADGGDGHYAPSLKVKFPPWRDNKFLINSY